MVSRVDLLFRGTLVNVLTGTLEDRAVAINGTIRHPPPPPEGFSTGYASPRTEPLRYRPVVPRKGKPGPGLRLFNAQLSRCSHT